MIGDIRETMKSQRTNYYSSQNWELRNKCPVLAKFLDVSINFYSVKGRYGHSFYERTKFSVNDDEKNERLGSFIAMKKLSFLKTNEFENPYCFLESFDNNDLFY